MLRHAGGSHVARMRVVLNQGISRPCRRVASAALFYSRNSVVNSGIITDVVALFLLASAAPGGKYDVQRERGVLATMA